MTTVFISYSHDDDTHRQRVLDLAERLRGDGLTVAIDRDHPGGPDEGWPLWCDRQVIHSDRVLVVCTETYRRRFDVEEAPGEGHGVIWEADALRQLLYRLGGRNNRVRPVLLDDRDQAQIPARLASHSHFFITRPDSYAELLSWLRGPVGPGESNGGELPWPEPDPGFDWGLADRRDEFGCVRKLLGGREQQRILLIEAPSGRGKSVLFNEIRAYARHLGLATSLLDFKGCPTLDHLFQTLMLDLGQELLSGTHGASPADRAFRLIQDLQRLRSPLLLLLDTYEQASQDSRDWLELNLLPRLDNAPAVVVVVGGQQVPDAARHGWRALADTRRLVAIDQPADWLDYIRARCGDVSLQAEQVELFIKATNGEPNLLSPLLDNLQRQAAGS